MSQQPPPTNGPELTSHLRSLLDPGRRVLSARLVAELSERDVEVVQEFLEAGAARPAGADVSHAIGALATRDRSDRTAAGLARLAADPQEEVVARTVAAASLRLLPTAQARTSAATLVDVPERGVRIAAVQALGCIGDEGSLRALDAMREPTSDAEARQRNFARSLIAHRLGRPSEYLPYRPGVARRPGSPKDYVELSLRSLRARAVAVQVESFSGSNYGIAFSTRVGFSLRAGRALWSVLVNDALGDGTAAFARSTDLFERPWITAVLARVQDRTDRSAPQYVVLTDPDEAGARLMVVRTDGEVMYSGSLSGPGDMRFVVRDIARRGTAPTHVRGRLTSQGIEMELSIPFGRRKNPSKGQVVTPR